MTGRPSAGIVPFIDLGLQYETMADEIDAAVRQVCRSGQFILGGPVSSFEEAFAKYVGVAESVCVNSGTAALQLALMAVGLSPGDEVIIPTNTFIATAEAVLWAGGTPVLVDVREDDFNIDPDAVRAAITPRTRAIVPVDLYGQPARLAEIETIAEQNGLFVVEDACQAHGASEAGRMAGSFGQAAAFSFYPGKNLGAFGEGGAIVTNDARIASQARMLRDHGQIRKYEHAVLGHNFRLEALQGAVLGIKLPKLDGWIDKRRAIANTFRDRLSGADVRVPAERDNTRHAYHLFVVRVKSRDAMRASLAQAGIETLVHYPIPLHRQRVLVERDLAKGTFPVADRVSSEIVSLPIFPEMTAEQIDRVCKAVMDFAGGPRKDGRR